jgi:type VI secretion system protein ImpB
MNTQDRVHNKLSRVRKPRVHITYDVETSGHQQTRELPFVIGVLGDYSGDNNTSRKSLKERKFINIDHENFDDTMAKIAPALTFQVEDVISMQPGKQLSVELAFHSMDDFAPENVVAQIPALRALLEARNRLRDLMAKVDRSEPLEELLEQVLQSQDNIAALAHQLGLEHRTPEDIDSAHTDAAVTETDTATQRQED